MSDLLKLDQPRREAMDLAETLRSRIAASLGVEASRILLSPTPEAFGLAGVALADVRLVGPNDCPVAAAILEQISPGQRHLECGLSARALRVALDALSPAGTAAKRAEDERRAHALAAAADAFSQWPEVRAVETREESVALTPNDPARLAQRLAAAGLCADATDTEVFVLHCPSLKLAEALASRLALPSRRSASIRRTTKETDIAVSLDLDRDGPARASTGIEFFDHMLDQVGRHGGFALDVTATGDVEVDAHHTIEDVCLALGEALREALGDKRGIARFGFELPMDETRAGVWIDLSGRPFAKFEGMIPGERVAGFPVEMTPHAFRSLAEAMKASVHVRVEGENAHHMIEACFKAFGRALRQAIRVEGNAIPSTKGAL